MDSINSFNLTDKTLRRTKTLNNLDINLIRGQNLFEEKLRNLPQIMIEKEQVLGIIEEEFEEGVK